MGMNNIPHFVVKAHVVSYRKDVRKKGVPLGENLSKKHLQNFNLLKLKDKKFNKINIKKLNPMINFFSHTIKELNNLCLTIFLSVQLLTSYQKSLF